MIEGPLLSHIIKHLTIISPEFFCFLPDMACAHIHRILVGEPQGDASIFVIQ